MKSLNFPQINICSFWANPGCEISMYFEQESSGKDQYMNQLEMFINYSTKIYSSSALLDYENTDLGKQSDLHQQLVLNSTEKEIRKKSL